MSPAKVVGKRKGAEPQGLGGLKKKKVRDEELSDEVLSDEGPGAELESEDELNAETADEARLRIAKQYLNTVQVALAPARAPMARSLTCFLAVLEPMASPFLPSTFKSPAADVSVDRANWTRSRTRRRTTRNLTRTP